MKILFELCNDIFVFGVQTISLHFCHFILEMKAAKTFLARAKNKWSGSTDDTGN